MPGTYMKSKNPLRESDNRFRLAPVISDEFCLLSETMACPGKDAYLRHLNGESLSRTQAINAKCYKCQEFNADGKRDCKKIMCPLYPFMLYGVRLREIRKRNRAKRVEQ